MLGFWLLFSTLALYDDEGYILISAREYFGHGGLYESVYSQYGPAFYVLADAVQHLARSPLDHTTARLLTLGLWLGAAAGCAILVHRQTASRLLAGFTLTATFFYLYFIIDEPFHPGSLICFLLALTLGVITELVDRGRLAGAAAVTGATAGLLVLTKINVGAFFLAGAGAWAVLNATAGRRRRAAGGAVAAALVLLAGVLMLALRREGWVQVYLALFAVGTVTLVAAVPPRPCFAPGMPPSPPRPAPARRASSSGWCGCAGLPSRASWKAWCSGRCATPSAIRIRSTGARARWRSRDCHSS